MADELIKIWFYCGSCEFAVYTCVCTNVDLIYISFYEVLYKMRTMN